MKITTIRQHLENIHPELMSKNLNYFQQKKKSHESRFTIPVSFKKSTIGTRESITASFKIAKIIAELGKPHTIAENLIKPSIKIAIELMVKKEFINKIEDIPLSNSTIGKRIKFMADDMENTIISILKQVHFSIQIDETLIRNSEPLVMVRDVKFHFS